jgi:hypothetical protein
MEEIMKGNREPPEPRPGHRWIGRLHLHLLDHCDNTVALIEFNVADDLISAWNGSQTPSVMNRETFRSWFWNPTGDLALDDLVWSSSGTRLRLTMNGSGPFNLPEVFVTHLAWALRY